MAGRTRAVVDRYREQGGAARASGSSVVGTAPAEVLRGGCCESSATGLSWAAERDPIDPHPTRLSILVIATVFIFGGPFVRQALDIEVLWLKAWQPYGNHNPDVCVADYRTPDGVAVSRLSTLYGTPYFWDVPLRERALTSKKHVLTDGRRMCRKLGVDDLRVHAKCATITGYRWFETGKANLCER